MGQNINTGQDNAVTVFGNPESFKKLIKNHGQLCKVKKALTCPCSGNNNGSPNSNCDLCGGEGFLFTYQRRFLVVDENSPTCNFTVTPFWNPIISVSKVENVTSEAQGGITELEVNTFDDETITLVLSATNFEKKRVTYTFDGWTLVESEQLTCDVANKIMYATGNVYNAGYQSSNPLNAYADIAHVTRLWNSNTSEEITDFTVEGNQIITSRPIQSGYMYANYYYADLAQVITTDIANRNLNEIYTHDLSSGECRMAFYPFWNLARGDIVVISATILHKNELIKHAKDLDKLWEIEIFALNDTILDEDGNTYAITTDYILQGRHIKWVSSNKPDVGKWYTIRYSYKPSYIIFEDNPQPNNLENKQYSVIVLGKSWTKISKDDVVRLMN